MILSCCDVLCLHCKPRRIFAVIFFLSTHKIPQPISVLKILTNKSLQSSWSLLIHQTLCRFGLISLQFVPVWTLRHIRDWSLRHYRPLHSLPLVAFLSLLRRHHVGLFLPPIHLCHCVIALAFLESGCMACFRGPRHFLFLILGFIHVQTDIFLRLKVRSCDNSCTHPSSRKRILGNGAWRKTQNASLILCSLSCSLCRKRNPAASVARCW